MRFRKLRIAWSVVWGVLLVLLIALWVRGLKTSDAALWRYRPDYVIGSTSGQGVLTVAYAQVNPGNVDWATSLRTYSNDSIAKVKKRWEFMNERRPESSESMLAVTVPHWFIALLLAATGALSWLPFTLRTLLIATTLVAVVLGLIVWALR